MNIIKNILANLLSTILWNALNSAQCVLYRNGDSNAGEKEKQKRIKKQYANLVAENDVSQTEVYQKKWKYEWSK